MSDLTVRDLCKKDTLRVLELMHELAVFEGYQDEFAVTESALNSLCFKQKRFNVLVAEKDDRVEGILVYFFQPFTYDLSPWLIIKELYISSRFRRSGLGHALFDEAYARCHKAGGKKMKWEVLNSNSQAQDFYISKGASLAEDWSIMSLCVSNEY